MAPSSSESSQELSYPTTQVNRSLASLDLDSLIMRSKNTRQLPEEAPSSLSESSYELLNNPGDSVYEDPSDDGYQTESLASTDGHTPDDASVADSQEAHFDEDDDVDFVPEHQPEHEMYHPEDSVPMLPSRPSPEESMMTSKADTQIGEPRYIELEEAPSKEGNSLEGHALLRRFDQSQPLPPVLSNYGCPDIQFILKLGLSPQLLFLRRQFRLLFLGDFPVWAEEDIAKHVQAAVLAPYPLLDMESHQDPDVKLAVDHCMSPNVNNEFEDQSTGFVTDDGVQLTFGAKSGSKLPSQSTNTLPDLVICCQATGYSTPDSREDMENLLQARTQFKRHGIPCLDLCTVRPYCRCPSSFDFDADSLRLCVEGRESNSSRFKLQETLPLEISSFLSIEPVQLNRHLRLITKIQEEDYKFRALEAQHGATEKLVVEDGADGSLHYTISDFIENNLRLTIWATRRELWFIILPLAALLVAYMSSAFTLPQLLSYYTHQQDIDSPMADVPSGPHVAPILCQSPGPSTPIVTSVQSFASAPSTPSVRSASSDLTIVPTKETVSEKQQKKRRSPRGDTLHDHSGGYEISALGDHEFILRPASEFVTKKAHPKLQVQVFRDSEPVPTIVSRLSNGIYTVLLENEYPFSTFDVRIVTKPKPLLKQAFKIELGSAKSPIQSHLSQIFETVDRLSQNAKEGLAGAQHNLKDLSQHVSELVKRGEGSVANIYQQSTEWLEQVQGSTPNIAEHLQEATRAAERIASQQLSVASKFTKDVLGQLQQTTWERTRPARTHKTMLKARKNALNLRGKLEKKLGKFPRSHEKSDVKNKYIKRKPGCKRWGSKRSVKT
ncbi:hypothetical protein BDV96DRAFT_561658 [Lophiotrema nucula]|uniref:Uncharacterized protein n=1 Tax=Lophiotrema nucula TaxID=690887 RepID=A0A6A5ZVD6_9PLEO|nr:hypothetical protein BDV96DRAFT_561658 [Lophiotrema nucula]